MPNDTYPAEFIHQNLAAQTNVLHQSWLNGVRKLLFLGSFCFRKLKIRENTTTIWTNTVWRIYKVVLNKY